MERSILIHLKCSRESGSTNRFNLYGNDLRIPGVGSHIGEISCIAPACADDMVIASNRRDTLQTRLDIVVDYSCQEHYLLQSVNSVLLEIPPTLRGQDPEEADITMKGQPMPFVQETMHMGILRSANSQESAVEENIKNIPSTYHLCPNGRRSPWGE